MSVMERVVYVMEGVVCVTAPNNYSLIKMSGIKIDLVIDV